MTAIMLVLALQIGMTDAEYNRDRAREESNRGAGSSGGNRGNPA